MTDRPIDISEPTKRLVRQRCGFGCVLCGLPIYQYDHMHGYTLETADDPEEITLLCSNHHDDKTRGRLPLEKVLIANEVPVNIKDGISTPYGLHYYGRRCQIIIANNNFDGGHSEFAALVMRDEEVISVKFSDGGEVLLNAKIRDRSGGVALSIVDNEMQYATKSWDIEYVGRTLTVREALGDILFELRFEPPSIVALTRANLQYGDVTMSVDATGFHVIGPGPRQRHLNNCSVGGLRYAITLDCKQMYQGVGFSI
jgi:hypothetical protein